MQNKLIGFSNTKTKGVQVSCRSYFGVFVLQRRDRMVQSYELISLFFFGVQKIKKEKVGMAMDLKRVAAVENANEQTIIGHLFWYSVREDNYDRNN